MTGTADTTPPPGNDLAGADAGGRDIVIRIRRRKATPPWRLGNVLGWSATALAGDPVLLLLPPFILIGLMLLAFALGAPGRTEVILPLISLPPIDAFQDVVLIDLGSRGALATWVLRTVALAIRVLVFGILVRLAVQRARDAAASLGDAVTFVQRRLSTLAFLELLSFGAFGVSLSLSADLTSTRDDGAIGTALLFGVLILIGAFIAAAADEAPAGTALRAGVRRVRHRPLGHIVLVLLYGFASNGLYRLASSGESGIPRALPLTLYAFLSALLTTWFLLAFARRQVILDGEAPATGRQRRTRRPRPAKDEVPAPPPVRRRRARGR
ncbi:MAG: hypothetical protein WAT66_14710 [Actinomycetota bacterium]